MTVLQGVPVVPGVRFAPVIRTSRLPALDQLDPGGQSRQRRDRLDKQHACDPKPEPDQGNYF